MGFWMVGCSRLSNNKNLFLSLRPFLRWEKLDCSGWYSAPETKSSYYIGLPSKAVIRRIISRSSDTDSSSKTKSSSNSESSLKQVAAPVIPPALEKQRSSTQRSAGVICGSK